MIFLPLSISAVAASAIPATHQPFGSPSAIAALLEAACGETTRARVGDGEVVEGEDCTGFLDADQARFELALSGADLVTTRPTESASKSLDDLRTRDVDLLVSLGFDESEFYDVQTRDILVTDAEEDGKLTRSYLGTMTFVSRGFGDLRVPNSRAVVVRDAAGALAVLTASWPALDVTTELIAPAPTYEVEDYAKVLGIEASDIEETVGVLALDGVADGAVGTARQVVAVSYRVQGPDGSTAGVVRYFDALTLTDSRGAP